MDTCDRSLIYRADVLFFNEFGFRKIKETAAKPRPYQKCLKRGGNCHHTLGEKGSLLPPKTDLFRTAALKQDVVDTTGAGDTFNSSFITYLLMGKSIKEAALFANTAGGYSVTQYGPKGGVNELSFIENLVTKLDQSYGRETRWDRKF